MKVFQIVETRQSDCDLWSCLATIPYELPNEGFSFYNEVYFCICCGRVWARRRWIDRECSWWINMRPHDQSPLSWYDFNSWPDLPPETQERFVNEFLFDPAICGYTGYERFPET